MMGVEMVLRSNSTKARRKMIARGVAGRNMASDNGLNQTSVVLLMFGERVCARHWPATRSEVGGCREGKRARADERAIRRVSDGDGAYGWYGCVCVWAGGARVARDGVIRQRETSWRWRRSAVQCRSKVARSRSSPGPGTFRVVLRGRGCLAVLQSLGEV